MRINAYATPHDILPGDLDGAAAVVIDTLRMTSVAAAAMQSGCVGLYTCAEVDQARRAAHECGEEARRLLGSRPADMPPEADVRPRTAR